MKQSFSGKKSVLKIIRVMFIITAAILILLPLLFTLSNSLIPRKEATEIYEGVMGSNRYINIRIFPYRISFEQYLNLLLFRPDYLQRYINSIILTFPIVLGQIIISILPAYAFAKMKFPFRNKIFFIYVIVMLMPYQVTLVPNYMLMNRIGLLGKFESIILPGIFSSFGVFLTRQYMTFIPDECIKAARIDGAGFFKSFLLIVLPQCKSILMALSLLSFIDNWNMVEQPIVMLADSNKYPFSVLMAFINENDIGLMFACGVTYMIPVLCFLYYGRSYLMQGIELSGIK